jgi:tetratricopeptide (TPR) repeat protein
MSISKQIAVLFSQIFFCAVCFAQDPLTDRAKIDSLQKILPSLHDSARVDCLNSIFRSYYWSGSDSFIYYVAPAYEASIRINYIHGIAEALNNKAILEIVQGNYANAEKLSRESLLWYDRTSNKTNITATFLTLGSVLKNQSFFHEAISYTEKAYDYSKKANDEIEMFLALGQLGSTYVESGDYEKAFDPYREGLQLILKLNSNYWTIIQLQLIGELYRDIEDYNTALTYFRQAYQRKKANIGFDYYAFAELFSLKNQFDSAKYYYSFIDTTEHPDSRLLVSLSEYYFQQKQFDKALNNALRALPYLRKYIDRNQVMRALLDIAKIYSAKGNYNAGFQYAEEGLMMARRTGSRHLILDGYQILYSIYDNWHKTDSAYFYYRHYVSMKDSILTDQIKGKLVAYSYEQRIELLDKEKLINQQQLNIQHQHLENESLLRDILFIAIIVALLLGFIFFRNLVLKRRSEKLESEKIKAELQKEKTDLEMQALRAQMNPHFIFNSLNSINRFILQKNSLQASEYLTKFSKLIRMILNSSANATVSLAEDMEALKLYLELERLRCEEKFSFKIKCNDELDADDIQVPPMLLQPFVENAIWHGLMHKDSAGHLTIDVQQENSTLVCIIADDGVGRKKSAELKSKSGHKSMGMKITESRIAMIEKMAGENKAVEIRDLVDADGNAAGTEVILKIPVEI